MERPLAVWRGVDVLSELVAGVLTGVAIAAVDGAIAAGLEGHLSGGAATVADHFVHLARRAAAALRAAVATGGTAGSTTGRLVGEALFREELLLGSGEGELGAAITASKGFVSVHNHVPPFLSLLPVVEYSCGGKWFNDSRSTNWNQEAHGSNKMGNAEIITHFHLKKQS